MKIAIEGNTFDMRLHVEFETDGTSVLGLLRKNSTEWRLSYPKLGHGEWIGKRQISHGEAIKRALACLERKAATLSLKH